jgi:hypothetical protein
LGNDQKIQEKGNEAKPWTIARNSSTSGRTLILVLLRLRIVEVEDAKKRLAGLKDQ